MTLAAALGVAMPLALLAYFIGLLHGHKDADPAIARRKRLADHAAGRRA